MGIENLEHYSFFLNMQYNRHDSCDLTIYFQNLNSYIE